MDVDIFQSNEFRKGRKEFGPDLKWVEHRAESIAREKNYASPRTRVSHVDVAGTEYAV